MGRVTITLPIALLLLLALLVAPAYSQEQGPLVVATTSLLGSVVEDLAGDEVEVAVVLSPSLCPAHYDVKPGDVYLFERADLILYHGFEPWVERLAEASGTDAPIVKVSGPWNTPEALEKYYVEVGSALEGYLGLDVSERLERSLEGIREVAERIKERAADVGAQGVKVVAMEWQKPFLSWLGLEVVVSYPPPERLSSKDLVELVEAAGSEGAVMVVDNLQSGAEFGRSLAERVGAVHVVLSNFPKTEPGANNMTKVFELNAERVFNAISNLQHLTEVQRLREELRFYQTLTYSLTALAVVEAVLVGYSLRRGRK